MNAVHLLPIIVVLAYCGTAGAVDSTQMAANCDGCHGPDGISSNSDVPIIAGQAFIVLENSLLAFRDQARPCRESDYRHGDSSRPATTMCAIAGALDDAQIEAISEYYEALPFVAAQQPFDASRTAAGAGAHEKGGCEMCHAGGGRLSNEMVPILAGQWRPYLEDALLEIKEGKRLVPSVVTDGIMSLSDEELEALLDFYASRQD